MCVHAQGSFMHYLLEFVALLLYDCRTAHSEHQCHRNTNPQVYAVYCMIQYILHVRYLHTQGTADSQVLPEDHSQQPGDVRDAAKASMEMSVLSQVHGTSFNVRLDHHVQRTIQCKYPSFLNTPGVIRRPLIRRERERERIGGSSCRTSSADRVHCVT